MAESCIDYILLHITYYTYYILLYSRNLEHAFKWKIKEHFSLRKRHTRPLSPLQSQRFWYLKAFKIFSMFLKKGIAFDNRRQKRVRIFSGHSNRSIKYIHSTNIFSV